MSENKKFLLVVISLVLLAISIILFSNDKNESNIYSHDIVQEYELIDCEVREIEVNGKKRKEITLKYLEVK